MTEVLAEDPNAKAHAYIRALERQLEEAKGKLATHRAFLVEAIRREQASAVSRYADGYQQSGDRHSDEAATLQSVLRAFDGDDETEETGEGGSGE